MSALPVKASAAAGAGPLGICAKSAAAFAPDSASRLEKWELQSYARMLLPAHRLRYCFLRRRPGAEGVGVWHSAAHGSAHYGGLMTCGSVWVCPVCAAKVAEERRKLLAAAVASCREMGGAVLLATYTVSHGRSMPLSDTLGAFLDAQRSMAGTRAYRALMASYGVVGAVKGLETTWGAANGWHPHCHSLLFVPREIDAARLADDLYPVWEASAKRRGLAMTRRRGLDVVAASQKVGEYVAKWGHAPTRRLWDTEDEIARAHMKRGRRGEDGQQGYTPFDLLRWLADTGESRPIALFREFAGVFAGRRQLVWSAGLADLLGVGKEAERSDEEIAEAIREEAALLATLTPAQWAAVRGRGLRGQLLEVARAGDVDQLAGFVAGVCADYAGHQAAGGAA